MESGVRLKVNSRVTVQARAGIKEKKKERKER